MCHLSFIRASQQSCLIVEGLTYLLLYDNIAGVCGAQEYEGGFVHALIHWPLASVDDDDDFSARLLCWEKASSAASSATEIDV